MFFKYYAISKNGKRIKGIVRSDNIESASFLIEEQELSILSIKKKWFVFHSKFSDFDLFLMFDFLSKFLSSGVTLNKALEMIGSCNIKTSSICSEMKNLVLKGVSFSKSLIRYDYKFNKNSLAVFSVIDKIGSLSDFSAFLANNYKKLHLRKKKIKSSLRYPITLIVFFFISFSVIVNFLVPNIISLLEDMGEDIPFVLRALNNISKHFSKYIMGLVFILVIGIIFHNKVDYYLNKIPIIKKYRFSRDFSWFFYINHIMLSNNVRLLNSFEITKKSINSRQNLNIINKVCENVKSGCSVSRAFHLSNQDDLLNNMIDLYEKSANLQNGFKSISEIYENEMFKILDLLSEYAQPFVLSILAILIGIVAYSMMIPVYRAF